MLSNSPLKILPLGFSETPPASPWGINFGGGLNSTAVMIECRNRGFKPDWILFADTGSERAGVLPHVARMKEWAAGWCDVITVRWIREDGTFEPLHENCLRTEAFPSKAYGYAGCTDKWKVQPMEKWRKANGFDTGAFTVGYDFGEIRRIKKACQRGDQPDTTAWYPLVAWAIDRHGCDVICRNGGFPDVPKSACFMCPNMKEEEWADLREREPELFAIALEIERRARARGERPQEGTNRATAGFFFDPTIRASILSEKNTAQESLFSGVTEDRCAHGGCWT